MKKMIGIFISAVLLIQCGGSILAEEQEQPQIQITVTEQPAAQASQLPLQDAVLPEGGMSTEPPAASGKTPPEQSAPEEQVSGEQMPEEQDRDGIGLFGISSRDWSFNSNLVTPRMGMQMVELGGELFAVGGYSSNGTVSSIEKYNGTTWSTVASIPGVALQGYTAASDGEMLYVIGGYDNGHYSNEVQIYHSIENRWETLPPMTRKRDQPAAFAANGRIYVFGGRDLYGLVKSYEYYDPQIGIWQEVTTGFDPSMLRIGARAAIMDGAVCMVGGINADYRRCGADVYSLPDLIRLENLLPEDTYDHITIAQGAEKALLFSQKYEEMIYETWELSLADGIQFVPATTADNFSNGAYGSEMVMHQGYLYCAGGCVPETKTYNKSVYCYKVYYGDFTSGDQEITSTPTAGGNELVLNVDAQKEYLVFIDAKNMPTFSGYTFTVDYDAGGFELVDGCALTASREQATGSVSGTNIEITQCSPGSISFISTDPVASEKAVSATVNAVRLRATESGQRKITYRMTQE